MSVRRAGFSPALVNLKTADVTRTDGVQAFNASFQPRVQTSSGRRVCALVLVMSNCPCSGFAAELAGSRARARVALAKPPPVTIRVRRLQPALVVVDRTEHEAADLVVPAQDPIGYGEHLPAALTTPGRQQHRSTLKDQRR